MPTFISRPRWPEDLGSRAAVWLKGCASQPDIQYCTCGRVFTAHHLAMRPRRRPCGLYAGTASRFANNTSPRGWPYEHAHRSAGWGNSKRVRTSVWANTRARLHPAKQQQRITVYYNHAVPVITCVLVCRVVGLCFLCLLLGKLFIIGSTICCILQYLLCLCPAVWR